MTAATAPTTLWDSIWLRLFALAVAIGGALLFIYVNQDFLTERLSSRSSGPPSAYQQCLNERTAAVDKMAADAGYTAKQKEMAEIRAQEFCHNKTAM